MMRAPHVLMGSLPLIAATPAATAAKPCELTPKEVVTRFMTQFYTETKARQAFKTSADPGYIQHNPMAATGRDAAIAYPEPSMAANQNGMF